MRATRFVRLGEAAHLAVWWVGATVALLLAAELLATAVYWVRGQAQPAAADLVTPMTVARSRIRMIPRPDVSAPGVHTDREGWRVEKPGESLFAGYSAGDYNIVLFGGSTMWGWDVRDKETVVAHLRALAANARSRDGRQVRIFNAGLPGYGSREELYLLVDFLREGRRIDLAVFYDGANEDECIFLDERVARATPGIRPLPEDRTYPEMRALMQIANDEPRLLPQNLRAVRFVRAIGRRLLTEAPAQQSGAEARQRGEGCARAYLADAHFARRIAQAWGTETTFVLQPLGALLPGAGAYPFPADGPVPPSTTEYYRALYEGVLSGARETALDVRDWSGLLDEPARRGEAIFLDPEHLTDRGNAIVATKLHEMLVAEKRIAAAPAGR